MLEYRPFRPEHLNYIQPQAVQRFQQLGMIEPAYAEFLAAGVSLSAWDGHRCVAAAGIAIIRPYRLALAWALLSRHAGPHMLSITRRCRQVIAQDRTPRIEMSVNADFEQGRRWALAVGMRLETPVPLRKHGANGEDEVIYARVLP
jgi:hypothetical protein